MIYPFRFLVAIFSNLSASVPPFSRCIHLASRPTDATKLAKKVRAPKKQLEAALAAHPDILKIDGHIAELEKELKDLGDR